jgi:hypothetical protein
VPHTIGIELIKPVDAEKMLSTMVKNRPVSEAKVLEYAIAIDTGKWTVNGETIKFDSDGRLFDGQHRLRACVLAEKAIRTYVARGIEDERAFATVDVGKNRTHSDIFGISGFGNPNLVSSVAMIVYLQKHGRIGWNGIIGMSRRPTGASDAIATKLRRLPSAHQTVQKDELLRFAEKIVEELASAARFAERWKQSRLLPRPMVGGTFYLFRERSFTDATQFFTDLDEGVGLARTDAVYHLRERLIDNASSNAKLSRWMVLGLMFKAWNKRRGGESVRYLRVQDGERSSPKNSHRRIKRSY